MILALVFIAIVFLVGFFGSKDVEILNREDLKRSSNS